MTAIKRFLPFLAWWPFLQEGKNLKADILAGITVALVLIPQSMAYAQLASLPAYYGLYAAFLPPMVAALFGSSRQLATGPVAVVSLMTAAALEPLASAGSEGYIAYAIVLSLTVGLFQLSLGLLRLGVLVNFLSHPVVIGFTNAAAIIIATSQLSKIFGVNVEKMPHHYETVWHVILAAIDHIHWPTFMMALLAFAIMIGLKRINPRIPNVLAAVLVTTVLSYMIGFQQTSEVSINRLVSYELQTAINNQTTLATQIEENTQKRQETQVRWQDYFDDFGPLDQRTLEAQHDLDDIEALLTKLKRQQKSAWFKIKETQLAIAVGAEAKADEKIYVKGEEPEGIEVQAWRITGLNFEKETNQLSIHSGGKVVGTIPEGLPVIKIPSFDWEIMSQLLITAVTIALIGFMEAISIAKTMAAKTRQHLDANQELVGQGLANILGSFSQSYPTSGSFSRSAVNISNGAVTGFSSVVTSIVVVITLLWLTPLLFHLPQATLAAVIMMAVAGLVNISGIKHAWHACPHDGVVSIVTFVITLAVAPHLDKGIMIGVGLSLVLFLYRTMEPRVVFINYRDLYKECWDKIGMVRFEGSLYFANIGYFEEKIQQLLSEKQEMKYVVIECVSLNDIDASGEEMIRKTAETLRGEGVEVLFSRVKTPVKKMLTETGFVHTHGEHLFFRRPELALKHIQKQVCGKEEAETDTATLKQATDDA